MQTFAFRTAVLILLALPVAACSIDLSSTSSSDDSAGAVQPFPSNFRDELLAFYKTYLNDPTGVHKASVTEPVQRTIASHMRYVSCVRYSARESDGKYGSEREQAVLFKDGRLDRAADDSADLCKGVTYAPFPQMEKMTR